MNNIRYFPYLPISKQSVQAQNYGVTQPTVNSVSEVNTAFPIYRLDVTMNGTKHAIFHIHMIRLMDRVFMFDNLEMLGIDQEKFVTRFFKQAGVATNKLNTVNTNPFDEMDMVLREFDNFLGSYFGEDDGRYDR